jgi:basic amino acid/polyamine antiporter, APA family
MNPSHKASEPLVKYFGLSTGIILIISSIIGSGVYKKVGDMAANCQSPGLLLLAWGLAGVVTMLGVLTLAEIAMLLPHSGGSFVYLHKLYGAPVAYSYGWASFACIQSASTAAIAYVFAQSFNAIWALPILGGEWETWRFLWIFTPFANLGVKLAAVALIIALTYINGRGVHQGGGLTNIITVTVVLSLIFMVIMNFCSGQGSINNLTTNAQTYPPEGMSGILGWFKVMFVTMLASFWAYEGWINIGFVGDEIHEPKKNIPRILIFGVLAIIAIYVCVNASYLFVMPIDELIALSKQENTVAAVEVVRKSLGEYGAYGISMLIVLTTAGCTNATILTSGRIYYAMAKSGLFFASAAHIDPKTKVPKNALWIFAVWSSVLVFSGTFDQLTDMLVFAQFIFYALVVAGVFVLRERMRESDRPYRTLGYPVVPILFVLFCIGLIINTIVEKPREAGIGLALIALGTPFYVYFRATKPHLHDKPHYDESSHQGQGL